ncbi:hypothetical protein AOE01nite_26100 [Acetobacter oeni]|uniref:Uncharacterized protein n=1 Tax=Acetobacter oeni TaxID=304077 RepID=A0A511XN75_9PROT|nr:hypothetical protein [Acetobacter oeni]GEN64386.1 hypothetical protein AOE01nite_26100 [Acetobacter oeni]
MSGFMEEIRLSCRSQALLPNPGLISGSPGGLAGARLAERWLRCRVPIAPDRL